MSCCFMVTSADSEAEYKKVYYMKFAQPNLQGTLASIPRVSPELRFHCSWNTFNILAVYESNCYNISSS